MAKPLRELKEQVVVITGASSGIGREAALRFGAEGASVVLAARNGEALEEVAGQVRARGGAALVVVTDVALWEQVAHLASAAVARFGRIDTWVNNAGISEYATLEDLPVADMERIIQVNLLGTMYGVKAALPVMKRQGVGTIINVGSGLGVRSIPLQGTYCTSKAGVKGFTEALRMELKHDYPDIHATLILPAAINTPFYDNARSRMGVRPRAMPPVYEAGAVAEAIVFAAAHPRRDIYVGSASKALAVLESIAPDITDRLMARTLYKMQQKWDEPGDNAPDNMDGPVPGPGKVAGSYGKQSRSVSLYTRAFGLHPSRARLLGVLALGAALWAASRRARA